MAETDQWTGEVTLAIIRNISHGCDVFCYHALRSWSVKTMSLYSRYLLAFCFVFVFVFFLLLLKAISARVWAFVHLLLGC